MRQISKTDYLKFIPILCMVGVIFFQLYQVHVNGLSPWRGGGFGMYSSIHHNQRKIRVSLYTRQGEQFSFVSFKGEWGKLGDKARIYPNTSNMQHLAQTIHDKTWVYMPKSGGIRVAEENENIPPQYLLQIDSTQVQVLAPKLLDQKLNIGIQTIKSFVYK